MSIIYELRKKLADSVVLMDSDLRWGPGHIVLDDLNLGDHSILWCLQRMTEGLTGEYDSPYIHEMTWHVLVTMLMLGRYEEED